VRTNRFSLHDPGASAKSQFFGKRFSSAGDRTAPKRAGWCARCDKQQAINRPLRLGTLNAAQRVRTLHAGDLATTR
jgi:hypothetical protein